MLERICNASIVPLLPDAMLTRQYLHLALIHDPYQLLNSTVNIITLHETNGNRGAHSDEETEATRLGNGLFLALLLLLGPPFLIVAAGWLLPMMNGTGWIGHTLWMVAYIPAFLR